MTRRDQALSLAIVLLLLLLGATLFRLARASNTIVNQSSAAPIKLETENVTYNLPSLPGYRSPFDWMQTSNLACDCDEAWQPLDFSGPSVAPVTSYPVYRNIYVGGGYSASPPPNLDFPIYTPPPLPTWHWETGKNAHDEKARYAVTSDHINGIIGKYSRKDNPGSYNSQTKTVTINGDNAYINGKHYIYDGSLDRDYWVEPNTPQPVSWNR